MWFVPPPVNNNIIKLKKQLENRQAGIREIAEDTNIFYGSAQLVLVNILGVQGVKARQYQETWIFCKYDVE